MFRSLKSSLAVHIPGLLAIGLMIGVMMARRPWPARAPVHFDFYWQADRWGSPWESGVFPVLAIFITVSGIGSSVMWSRHEDGRKRFNLTLPILVAPLGVIAGIHLWYWWNLPALASAGHAPGGWVWAGIGAVLTTVPSIILEKSRKAIPEVQLPLG